MNRIKKGDTVVVVSGNDKNRQGKVLRILKKENRAIVENVNVLKHFTKADPQRGTSGGIVSQEAPIPLSKLMLYNPTTKKADKISIQVIDNKKVRCFRSNGERIDLV
jgi:large subunit ribosomal protein L24